MRVSISLISSPFTDANRLVVGALVFTSIALTVCSVCLRLATSLRQKLEHQRNDLESQPRRNRTPRWHGNGPNAGYNVTIMDYAIRGTTGTALWIPKSTTKSDRKFHWISRKRTRRILRTRVRRQVTSTLVCDIPNPCSSTKFNMRSGCDPNLVNGVKISMCRCYAGYEYDIESTTCEIVRLVCGQSDTGCLHNGECQNVPTELYDLIGRSYNCKCKPSWQGLRCEMARNPCRIPVNRQSCGRFDCRRNPADEINGYQCVCPAGYTQNKQTGRPSCRDIDECATTKPCRNGGDCRNEEGSYRCECKWGFRGAHCEIQPPEPFWLSWSPWSSCSTTCSSGLQYRRRECSLTGSCLGIRKDVKNCMGKVLECYGHHRQSDPRKRAGGAGWQPDEDKILDDAWYFREFQLLRMGLHSRSTFEDDLIGEMQTWLYEFLPLLSLIGIAETLIILVLLRRNRVRRTY